MKHVYLIGLPGCGKTTLGAMAAKALGLPFYDTDEYVEEKSGLAIARIFAQRGEAAFRALERDAIKEIARLAPGVAATGGGAPLSPENELVLRKGFVIYIDRPPEEIAKTVDYASRPLLPDARTLLTLDAARRPAYERLMHARVRSETIECGVNEILAIVGAENVGATAPGRPR